MKKHPDTVKNDDLQAHLKCLSCQIFLPFWSVSTGVPPQHISP